jgi:hypothetical protein
MLHNCTGHVKREGMKHRTIEISFSMWKIPVYGVLM